MRDELQHEQEGPRETVRREVLGLAYLGSPAARTLGEPAGFTRDDALQLWRRIAQPERSYHVLTGGFDVAEVRALLEKVFARSAIAPVPAPAPPAVSQGQQRASTIPTTGAEAFALAVPVPADADDRELAIVGRLLAHGRFSLLGRALRKTAGRDFDVDFTVPFPHDRRPGLFLLEVQDSAAPAADSKPGPRWPELIHAALADVGNSDLDDAAVTRASKQVESRIAIARSSPAELAFDLAEWCGVRGIDPAMALSPFPSPDADSVRSLVVRLFVHGPRVEVSLERAR